MLQFIRKLPAGVQALLFAASAIGVAVGLAILG
jgi:hypothetical protein